MISSSRHRLKGKNRWEMVLFYPSYKALVDCMLIPHISGITITESWGTANVLDSKIEFDNSITQGLKAEIQNAFSPAEGNRGQKLNLYFKQPSFHLRSFFHMNNSGNINATVDGVIGHDGFLVGGEAGYDVQKAAVTRYSAAVGYSTPLYSAAITATNNLSVYAASYYQKINSSTEFGAKASMDSKNPQTIGLEIASKYRIDPLSFAKVRYRFPRARPVSKFLIAL